MRRWQHRRPLLGLVFALLCDPSTGAARETVRQPPGYREQQVAHGKLVLTDGVWLLAVDGTPEQKAKAMAQLIGPQIRWLAPRYLERMVGTPVVPAKLRRRIRTLAHGIPRAHREQLAALATAAGVDLDALLAANLAPELKSAVACSCMGTNAPRSADGKVRLARNLDWPAGDLLAGLELVIIERSGGQVFASFGWPGMVGVVTGMNQSGLSVADLMAYPGGKLRVQPGVPVLFVVRTLLERTSSVAAALGALKRQRRTMPQNYALADSRETVAVETGPKHFYPRPARAGLALITNYYREDRAPARRGDRRYARMWRAGRRAPLDTPRLTRVLRDVALGKLNVQSAVLVPVERVVHLAIGPPPAARGRWIRLDLAPWLAAPTATEPPRTGADPAEQTCQPGPSASCVD